MSFDQPSYYRNMGSRFEKNLGQLGNGFNNQEMQQQPGMYGGPQFQPSNYQTPQQAFSGINEQINRDFNQFDQNEFGYVKNELNQIANNLSAMGANPAMLTNHPAYQKLKTLLSSVHSSANQYRNAPRGQPQSPQQTAMMQSAAGNIEQIFAQNGRQMPPEIKQVLAQGKASQKDLIEFQKVASAPDQWGPMSLGVTFQTQEGEVQNYMYRFDPQQGLLAYAPGAGLQRYNANTLRWEFAGRGSDPKLDATYQKAMKGLTKEQKAQYVQNRERENSLAIGRISNISPQKLNTTGVSTRSNQPIIDDTGGWIRHEQELNRPKRPDSPIESDNNFDRDQQPNDLTNQYDHLRAHHDPGVREAYEKIMQRHEENMERRGDYDREHIFATTRTRLENLDKYAGQSEGQEKVQGETLREMFIPVSKTGLRQMRIKVPETYLSFKTGGSDDGVLLVNDPREWRSQGIFWNKNANIWANDGGVKLVPKYDGNRVLGFTIKFHEPGNFLVNNARVAILPPIAEFNKLRRIA